MRFQCLFLNTISLAKQIDLYCGNRVIYIISGVRRSRLTEHPSNNGKERKPLREPYWEFRSKVSWSSSVQSIRG